MTQESKPYDTTAVIKQRFDKACSVLTAFCHVGIPFVICLPNMWATPHVDGCIAAYLKYNPPQCGRR